MTSSSDSIDLPLVRNRIGRPGTESFAKGAVALEYFINESSVAHVNTGIYTERTAFSLGLDTP